MVKTRHSADADDLAYGEFITVATRTNRREAALKSRNYRDDDSDDFEDEPPPTRRRTRGKRNITIFGGSTTDDETPPKDTRRGRFRDTGAMDDSLEDGGLPSRRHAPHHHLPPDSEIRRSGRQRKLTYDTLNQGLLNKQLAYLSASEMNGYHDQLIDQPIKKRKRTEVHIEPEDEEAVVDMYTRVKRERRHVKRNMYGVPIEEKEGESSGDDRGEDEVDEEDENEEETEEEEEPHQNPRSYFLREQRQRTQIYEAPIEPKRNRPRSIFREGSPPINRTRNSSRGAIHRSPARRKSIRRKAAFHRSSSTSSSSDPASSDDERRFERRKAKSMVKSRQRCLPMNLSQDDVSKGFIRDRVKIGSSLADVDPMNIDRSVTFEKVGGLGKHIRALKEMVVFPLLYPEVFDKFKITPPRGVLFYGPPGTGKTLVARALANECSTGEKKVAFFMRKGADCLSKWVGESERQLRLLFDQAYQMRPAIIFFDEIDGLAPVRSSRQDQIHSSIVSTLLALMDGLDNRGEIVVIGATNRIDSIDPALRRPGRFDREFLFPLPSVQARSQILQIHTSAWSPKLSERFIHELADKCVGYCGADLRALCTEAALQALRRRYPQIYNSQDKLQLDTSAITVNAYDFHRGTQIIVPTAQRSASSPARALSHTIQPLLHELLHQALGILKKIFPPALSQISSVDTQATNNGSAKPADGEEFCSDIDEEGADIYEQSTKGRGRRRPEPEAYTGPFLDFTRSSYHHPTTHRPRLLLTGEQGQGQSTHIAPGILYYLERMPVHVMDLPALYAVSAKTPEESCAHIFREAKRTCPSIIYVPHIDHWWEVIGDTLRATFLTLLRDLEPSTPLLFLATSDEGLEVMPITLRQLFNNQTEVLQMRNPSADERREYFQDLLLNQATKPPAMRKQAAQRALEVLPKAPAPPPPTLTDTELKRLTEQEEVTLRELRLFLREVLNKLGRDRKFALFAKPVDEEEVPDYYNIIASPMDLSTMMNKIDLHKYQTVADFMRDVELIVSNALEYNPEKDPADRAIRHRACTLKDTAQAILAAELDEGFEKLCEEIKESMDRRGAKASASVPSYYFTKPLGRGRQGLRDAVNGPDNVSGRASRHATVMDPEAPLSSNAGTNDDDEVIVPKVRTIIKRVMLPRSKNRHTSPWCRPSKRAYRKIVVYLDEQGNEIGQESTLPRARQDKPKQEEEEEEPEEDETEDKQEEKSEEEVENETKDSDKGINSVDNNGNTLSVDVSEREASPKRATPSPRSALSPRGRPSPASPRQSRSPRGEGARREKSPASSLERSGRSSRDKQKTEAQTPCTGLSNKKRPRTLSEQSDAEAMDTAVTKETSDTEVTIKSADNSPKKTNSPSKTTTTTTAEETATEEKTEEVMETEEKSDLPKMRVTRSQMHPSDHQRALELLSETSQSVLVDEARLRALLTRVVRLTEGHNVEQLERLYSSLSQCIYHHRRDANKMELLQSARNKRYQQRRSGPKLVPIAWDLIFDMEAVIASYSFKI